MSCQVNEAVTEQEGVIKYRLDHAQGAPPPWPVVAELEAWRRLLVRLGLVGQDPARYDGFGFGNVSLRSDRGGFWVSGTQTGHMARLEASHYVHVDGWDIAGNRLSSHGAVQPSSEAMTHAAVYDASPGVNAVLHAHSPDIWQAAEALGYPVTGPSIPYGTPQMATAVVAAARHAGESGVVVMGGHLDGVLAFGETLPLAGMRLLDAFRRALMSD